MKPSEYKFRYWDDGEYVYFDFDDIYYHRLQPDNGITDPPDVEQFTGLKDALDNELWFGDNVEIYVGRRLHSRENISNLSDLAYLMRLQDDSGATFEVIRRVNTNEQG
jgi:hypothetical protein